MVSKPTGLLPQYPQPRWTLWLQHIETKLGRVRQGRLLSST